MRASDVKQNISATGVSSAASVDNEESTGTCQGDVKDEKGVLYWGWDQATKSKACLVSDDLSMVTFHPDYSCGTSAIRGTRPLVNDQFYWEIKMASHVYGTDMMVGVGTENTKLDKNRYTFVSLLGSDSDSWGFSYTGFIQHRGHWKEYSRRWTTGTVIGCHLDAWRGTLEFYMNGHSLGVAFEGLQGLKLYPMIASTAACSEMKLQQAVSFNTSLEYLCCARLRQLIRHDLAVLDVVDLPPGLQSFLANNLSWLLSPKPDPADSTAATGVDDTNPAAPQASPGPASRSSARPKDVLETPGAMLLRLAAEKRRAVVQLQRLSPIVIESGEKGEPSDTTTGEELSQDDTCSSCDESQPNEHLPTVTSRHDNSQSSSVETKQDGAQSDSDDS